MSDLAKSMEILEARQQAERTAKQTLETKIDDIMRLVDAHRNLRWTVISQYNESRQRVEDALRTALGG